MSERHLSSGSPEPAALAGKVRVYSMAYCPFAQRTRLVLAHKGIPHEVVNINTRDKPEWFLAKTPLALVPTLEHNGDILYESAICNEYLDEVFPEKCMTPADPLEKARMKMLMERFNKYMAPARRLRMGKSENEEEDRATIHNVLMIFEDALQGKFFGGEDLSLLDAYLWPWLEKVPFLREQRGLDVLPAAAFPRLSGWMAAMAASPAVRAAGTPMQHYAYVTDCYSRGVAPDYDVGLQDH